ncbi:MAG: hypothetical protein R8L53_05615 [Mariprofundales bacterium]
MRNVLLIFCLVSSTAAMAGITINPVSNPVTYLHIQQAEPANERPYFIFCDATCTSAWTVKTRQAEVIQPTIKPITAAKLKPLPPLPTAMQQIGNGDFINPCDVQK